MFNINSIMESYGFKTIVRVKNGVSYIVIPSNITKALKTINGMEVYVDLSNDLKKNSKPLTEKIVDWFESYSPEQPLSATIRTTSIEFSVPTTKASILLTALVVNGTLIQEQVDGVSVYKLKKMK